jgi:hypothetical protein
MKIRKSVPTEGLAEKYLTGSWRYVMPDFDRPDHSIIESTFCNNRVPPNQTKEECDDGAGSQQQPAA